MKNRVRCSACLILLVLASFSAVAEDVAGKQRVSLPDGIRPFTEILAGTKSCFELCGQLKLPIAGKPQAITMKLSRFDDVAFDLVLTHADYAVEIRRRANSTTLVLPKHNVAFVGEGDDDSDEVSMSPQGILNRIVSPYSGLAEPIRFAALLTPEAVEFSLGLAAEQLKALPVPGTGKWRLTDESPVQFFAPGVVTFQDDSVDVKLTATSEVCEPAAELAGMKIISISRSELERTLVRGVHRATEVLKPGRDLREPSQRPRSTSNGELRWIGGQRVALLSGTAEQIGEAHGMLLKDETIRCIESVLYSFGTAHVIRTGRWFRSDLDAAYKCLAPFIPERHKRETRALAVAIDLPAETAEVLNVFPELFHCSGFAVFDSATKDGKLYHGRVLDYMTTIGLQDAATTFVVKPDGYLPFANVGYAGFIGSVSGMNSKAISLGEMGGHGEGQWDGVPMATLMRRALEECSTLDEVITLWTESPRTCEYYYVFADGKTNRAVGVSALPESIEFIQPGEGHERLGAGIKDSIVLSAGSRLEELRKRVTEKHGQIDAELGKWLMSRPVAMQSNLHNVLFVPADGILYVANASHSRPAAEQPYVKLSLTELLKSVPTSQKRTAASR